MIEWLVQTPAAHADLARGLAPAGLLAPEERDRLAGLRVPKRRSEWLLGRWTAKQLLRGTLGHRHGVRVPLDSLVLRADPRGAPRAYLLGAAADEAVELPLSLSVSHRDAEAFCALSHVPSIRVGADLETAEPRSASFVADYFTAEEQALVRELRGSTRHRVVATIWSGKEAVLKALGLGLTVDTRRICCLPETHAEPDGGWHRLQAHGQAELWRAAGLEPDGDYELRAWWSAAGRRIRTIAALQFRGASS